MSPDNAYMRVITINAMWNISVAPPKFPSTRVPTVAQQ